MTLNKPAYLQLIIFSFLVCCLAIPSAAQPEADLERFRTKYPGSFYITETDSRDVTFQFGKNGQPQITITDYNSLFVLTENATNLSESKEYFSSKFEVKSLEAYSLVPGQGSYKKQSVTGFTKSIELSEGVFYDDLYAYIFHFPSVAKGTRLVTTSTTVNTDPYFPIVFYFGNHTPVDQVQLTLTLPAGVDISYHMFGYDTTCVKFTQTKKGRNIIYQWSGNNPKSYIGDELAPSFRYYIPHIIINIAGYTYNGKYTRVVKSLKDLYDWDYSNISRVNSTISPEIKRLADSVCAGSATDREKVARIYRWVQQNIKYVAIEDGDNGHVPREASLVLQRRYGDCKDKSSLLTAMIRAVGLKSGLAWLGTRDLPYKYSVFPSINNSNHMIAVWWDENNNPVLLDGTTLFHALGQVPSSIQGKQCIIEKGAGDFMLYNIPVATPDQNVTSDTVWIKVENGILKGKGAAFFTGESKPLLLALFERSDSSQYKNILYKHLPKASNKCNYTAVHPSDLRNIEQPLRVAYNFELPDYITANGNSVYLNMNVERFLGDVQVKADRWLPLEFDEPGIHRYVCILEIPANTVAGSLPESTSFKNPDFSFSQQYSQQGNTIMLCSEIINNGLLVEGEQILPFANMLAKLNKAYKKSIVLTKK
jgi:transglutaminase-like putative cysteine protease